MAAPRVRIIAGWREFLLGILPFLVILAVWSVVTSRGLVREFFLPTPAAVLDAITGRIANGSMWADLRVSFGRVSAGYLLAALAGIPVGIALGYSRIFRAVFEPLNNFIRYTPLPAFVPLVVLWVGIGDGNAVTLVFLGVFWTFSILVGDAVASVPAQYIESARTLGYNQTECLFQVVLPFSSPGIYDALRIGAGWAWSSLVLAEIVGANSGLGHMLMEAQRFLRTADVVAGILIVGLLGLLTDQLFIWGYPRLFGWTERAQKTREAHRLALGAFH